MSQKIEKSIAFGSSPPAADSDSFLFVSSNSSFSWVSLRIIVGRYKAEAK